MSPLPTGTVTFLFTDIQSSTRMWQDHTTQMNEALLTHDKILHEAIASYGGYVFKTVGDAFCGAFDTAMDGFNAALSAQLRIARESWDPRTPVKCRMGLHTGEAVERNGDYYGPAVNRSARIESIGHGGQTLISLVTCELIRDTLPDDVSLRDLGEARLKDLMRPETIFQLIHPDLPSEFPPLKSLDKQMHNLPVQATLLFGREAEIQRAVKLLEQDDVRVVTLNGPGGIGKTRLSMQIGAEVIERFNDGVFFIDLSTARTEQELIIQVANTFHISESPGRDIGDDLNDYFRSKKVLLIFDNLEQITDPTIRTAELVRRCEGLRVLATSREPLRIRGEHVIIVEPLRVPVLSRVTNVDISYITQYDSVQLFIDRARSIDADFTVTRENAASIAGLCHRLDGIPLAIELAAARVNLLSPETILRKLETALTVLSHGAHDLPKRQQTLSAAIDWSFDLLEDPEKRLFVALSVFRSGFSLDAAEEVLSESMEGIDILEGVSSLLEKSLLTRRGTNGTEKRLGMLETIQMYADQKLQNLTSKSEIDVHHAEYYYRFAYERTDHIEGAKQREVMVAIDFELENIRKTFDYYRDHSDEKYDQLISHLWKYFRCKGRYEELRSRISESHQSPSGKTVNTAIYLAGGVIDRCQGKYDDSLVLLQKGLRIAYENSMKEALSELLFELGWTCVYLNRFNHAEFAFGRSAEIAAERGEEVRYAMALHGRGAIALRKGSVENARNANDEALQIFVRHGLKRQQALALANLGYVYFLADDSYKAIELLTEAERITDELGECDQRKVFLNNIADQCVRIGEYNRAESNYQKLVRLANETGDTLSLCRAQNGLCECALFIGDAKSALAFAKSAREHLSNYPETADRGVNLRLYAQILENRGEYKRAEVMYQKSIEALKIAGEIEELEKAQTGLERVEQMEENV